MVHIGRIMMGLSSSPNIEDDTQEEQTNAIHYEAHFFVRSVSTPGVESPISAQLCAPAHATLGLMVGRAQ